jgi:hypothetical protein
MSTHCKCFETWGFTDRYPPDFAGGRPVANSGLPWDADYQPKPAVYEMEHELHHGDGLLGR